MTTSEDVLAAYLDDLLSTGGETETLPSPAPAHKTPEVLEVHSTPLLKPSSEPVMANTIQQNEEDILDINRRQVLEELLKQRTRALFTESQTPSETVASELNLPQPLESEGAPVLSDPRPETSARSPPNKRAGRPQWAESRFDILLFDVAGLTLAVPLVTLGQIVPITEKMCRLQGQSEWFIGILPTPIGDIRCVDTAKFVMPEKYREGCRDRFRYVVTLDGHRWGLAVDAVRQPVSVQPDEVKWRSQQGKRPWLAGTLKPHMCALLDIPEMAVLLKAAAQVFTAPGTEAADGVNE